MAEFEQKIFEQVIDSYFGETNNTFRADEDVNIKGVKLKVKQDSQTKEDNSKKTVDNQKKKRESKSKAVLIEAEYHENLPVGWKKVVVQRTTGATAGKYDVYFFTPSGRKLRSKNEIKDYSEKHNLSLDLSNFGFSRPKRGEPNPVTKISNKKSKSKKGPSNQFDKDSNSTSFDMSDSSNHIDSQFSNPCEENDSMTNGDNCVSVDNQILNCIDQDIKAFAAEVLEPVIELDLPNTSFSNSNAPNDKVNVENASYMSSVELDDIDQSHLGKTFKIERPLSFSCF